MSMLRINRFVIALCVFTMYGQIAWLRFSNQVVEIETVKFIQHIYVSKSDKSRSDAVQHSDLSVPFKQRLLWVNDISENERSKISRGMSSAGRCTQNDHIHGKWVANLSDQDI